MNRKRNLPRLKPLKPASCPQCYSVARQQRYLPAFASQKAMQAGAQLFGLAGG